MGEISYNITYSLSLLATPLNHSNRLFQYLNRNDIHSVECKQDSVYVSNISWTEINYFTCKKKSLSKFANQYQLWEILACVYWLVLID